MAEARDLDFESLLERVEAILAAYDKPDVETQHQKVERIGRILEEMPQVYRWLLGLQSWLDHWTDAINKMFGQSDARYKASRQRRDLFKNMASAAKLRYESASRMVTLEAEFDPLNMPRHR